MPTALTAHLRNIPLLDAAQLLPGAHEGPRSSSPMHGQGETTRLDHARAHLGSSSFTTVVPPVLHCENDPESHRQ